MGGERRSSHSAEYTALRDGKQTERDISSHLADLGRGSLSCAAQHQTHVSFNVLISLFFLFIFFFLSKGVFHSVDKHIKMQSGNS